MQDASCREAQQHTRWMGMVPPPGQSPPPAHGQSCRAATTGCRRMVPWLWGGQSCHGSLGDVSEGHLGRANSTGPQALSFNPLPVRPRFMLLFRCRAEGRW